MLEYAAKQLSKFRIKNCVEINDDGRRVYNTNSQFKFKATMLKSSLCDYRDAYILVKVTIPVVGQGADPESIAADITNILQR